MDQRPSLGGATANDPGGNTGTHAARTVGLHVYEGCAFQAMIPVLPCQS